MTVSVNESSKRFHGSGSTGPFTWTWRFLANSDVNVYLITSPDEDNPSSESKLLLVETTDYTLTGAGTYLGGSLTLVSALAVGADLLVERMTAPLQNVSIRNQGNNFRPEVHEEVFDRLTMMIQDRDRIIAELQGRVVPVDLVTLADGVTTLVNVNAASGETEVDLSGLTGAIVIKEDDSANAVVIIDTSGNTVARQVSLSLQVQDESIRLVLIDDNWKRVG